MKQFVEVGQRVRHLSPNGARSRCATWPEGVWLEHGIEGTVIEYHPALPRRVIGDEVFERLSPVLVGEGMSQFKGGKCESCRC